MVQVVICDTCLRWFRDGEMRIALSGSERHELQFVPPGITLDVLSLCDSCRDAYDRMSADYQAMAELAASVTLDQLRHTSIPVDDIEDAIA